MHQGLISHFESLPDPRVDRTKRYPLIEIILLSIAATVSGCEGWKQIRDFGEAKLDWLRKFLPYEEGIPVDDTIARVMRKLDTKAFQRHFIEWMKSVSHGTDGDIVAIDGKTLRRSHNRKQGVSAIHMVSAWSSENGVVLGQEKTAEKSNEITAIPELLKVLDLEGCIVTIDAMGCQKSIAQEIINRKADYVLALKGNQNRLYTEAKDFFEQSVTNEFKHVTHNYHEEYDYGHGRIEYRQCWQLPVMPSQFLSTEKWINLKSIVVVRTHRDLGEKTTDDTRFFISSVEANAEKMLHAVRQHWSIENSLHWVLDVTFREDESRIRTGASPENCAILRHIALNIIKADESIKASVKRKKLRAALIDEYRENLIRQII